jgi:hypothetical protein
MSSGTASPRPKNWLLAKSRQWHTWGGLIAGLFLLPVGISGVVLNYKNPIFTALGLEQNATKPDKSTHYGAEGKGRTSMPRFTTASGLAEMPTSVERAFELARAAWGDVPLERIELKVEHGEPIYKLKQRSGPELWVNAATGEHFAKGEYERFGKAGADGMPTRQTDWGKILLDLHTGKIAGESGKAVISVAALLLVFLSLSGVYMWAKPLLIRRSNARTKALGTVTPPVCATTPTVRASARELANF